MPHLPIAVDLPNTQRAIGMFTRCLQKVPVVEKQPLWVPIEPLIVRAVLHAPQDTAIYLELVKCLVRVNRWCLTEWPFPPLLSSGVQYEAEFVGEELFQSTPALYLRGKGDCEDIVAARVAEYPQGTAEPEIRHVGFNETGGRALHLVVRRKDGSIEDPSRTLGM